jgi:hypothetical protein
MLGNVIASQRYQPAGTVRKLGSAAMVAVRTLAAMIVTWLLWTPTAAAAEGARRQQGLRVRSAARPRS